MGSTTGIHQRLAPGTIEKTWKTEQILVKK